MASDTTDTDNTNDVSTAARDAADAVDAVDAKDGEQTDGTASQEHGQDQEQEHEQDQEPEHENEQEPEHEQQQDHQVTVTLSLDNATAAHVAALRDADVPVEAVLAQGLEQPAERLLFRAHQQRKYGQNGGGGR